MRIKLFLGTLGCFCLSTYAQQVDSLRNLSLSEVVVEGSYRRAQEKKTAFTLDVLRRDDLRKHFTGNLVQTIENTPGVQAMDIGSGFSKPMIRGFGFNRVAVSENGIKQEGQQWGADHGLEIDAFGVEEIRIRKGPASLLYGSDAMGGVIEILPPMAPVDDQIYGQATTLVKSVNGTLGGSLMLGLKKGRYLLTGRFSEQHFGDYRVPADSISYLTQILPIYGRRLKNTAGFERDGSLYLGYTDGAYQSSYALSSVYQKVGFFPGAHGVPDGSRLIDDGDSRNIDLPFSWVHHLKVTSRQRYAWERLLLSADWGYQLNHREEWSVFHTHYGNQSPPNHQPDRELAFNLQTFSSSVKLQTVGSSEWKQTWGVDAQWQHNSIGGYSFLLPAYRRWSAGGFWLVDWTVAPSVTVSGGARYDWGKTRIDAFRDTYLENYLSERHYSPTEIEAYQWRSYAVNRSFGDYSCALGLVWTPTAQHVVKINLGRSFRLPGANELASNGVHHGTFRHEQGDATLDSEQGWQLDASYHYTSKMVELSLSPFISRFSNYIYLKPTGEWSVLPDAGQIYRYTRAEVLFAGGEVNFNLHLLKTLSYRFSGEWVHTYNYDEHTALSFSPPPSMRHVLTWHCPRWSVDVEFQQMASQRRVARNEDPTSGTHLFHLGARVDLPIGKTTLQLSAMIRNVFDVRYQNHLSFYRKVELPEPGRNIQLIIQLPFKKIL